MRPLLFFFLLSLTFNLEGQKITGRIVDDSTGESLVYVSIGVIDSNQGTISDEQGDFTLVFKNLPDTAKVRFSMIGYTSQIFFLRDLLSKENIIRLASKTNELTEVVVKPSAKPKKIGTLSFTRGILCGWGGTDTGKGYEIGTKLALGDSPVRIRKVSLYLHKQSYDSTLIRLHIRRLVNGVPGDELLNSNIFITINKESGWIETNLSDYNLVLDGDILMSIEWIKIFGVNDHKLVKINGQEKFTANVLFREKRNEGCLFTRWGSEAKWSVFEDRSPCFYITVQ